MAGLEFDHVFLFCDPSLPEADLAVRHGFKLGGSTVHAGQGTSNKFVLFQDCYLEFILISNLREARENPLRLDRRAEWKSTGASPFGIGLRGSIPAKQISQFWDYYPEYMPGRSLKILKAPEELPLIFVLPAMAKSKKLTFLSELFDHKNGARRISNLEFSGPSYAWPNLGPIEKINFSEAKVPHLAISLSGDVKEKKPKGNKTTKILGKKPGDKSHAPVKLSELLTLNGPFV